jgi:hypothetical protein
MRGIILELNSTKHCKIKTFNQKVKLYRIQKTKNIDIVPI